MDRLLSLHLRVNEVMSNIKSGMFTRRLTQSLNASPDDHARGLVSPVVRDGITCLTLTKSPIWRSNSSKCCVGVSSHTSMNDSVDIAVCGD